MLPLLALALAPLLVTLDNWEGWKGVAEARGWQWVAYDKDACNDSAAKSIEAMIGQRPDVDRNRIYLASRGGSADCVFYNASRLPDVWAAAVAIEGDPQRAIDTNRIFAANLQMLPILWVGKPDPARPRLPGVTQRNQATTEQAMDFLAEHPREPWPLKIDCETGNPNFVRCFWVQITKADVTRRNDALPVSRIAPGSGARLAPGTIKPEDKVLSINGKDPVQFLETVRDDKAVVVMVQRGKDRVRLDGRVLLPVREEGLTIRIQGEVQPDTKEILMITRGVAQVKMVVPPHWAPATLNWNGPAGVKLETAGCYILTDAGGTISSAPCR
jgi:hypothetical protein